MHRTLWGDFFEVSPRLTETLVLRSRQRPHQQGAHRLAQLLLVDLTLPLAGASTWTVLIRYACPIPGHLSYLVGVMVIR